MKTMKAICKATVLALSLSVSAFAGDIANPDAPIGGTIRTTTSVSTLPASQTTTSWSATGSEEVYFVVDSLVQLVALL
jgi:hypothetical protein